MAPISIAAPIAAQEPLPMFDCSPAFEPSMTPGWKAWCCLNKRVGCPPTSTTTSTVTTRTSTSTVTSTTTTPSPEEGCQQSCSHVGIAAKCGDWIVWASEDAARAVENTGKNSCGYAEEMVLKQCPGKCNFCTAAAAGCTEAQEPMTFEEESMFFRKFEERPSEEATALIAQVSRFPVLFVAGLGMLGGAVALAAHGLWRFRRGRGRSLQVELQGLVDVSDELAAMEA